MRAFLRHNVSIVLHIGAMVIATTGLVSADTFVHSVFYIDESCTAYALSANQNSKPFGLSKTMFTCAVAKDGVPTIMFANSGNIDYTITTGDIELLEEPSFTQPSDVLKISKGPVVNYGKRIGDRQTYMLKFYSDANEGFDEGGSVEPSVPADVGFNGIPFPKPVTCKEQDLTNATTDWRLNDNGNPFVSPIIGPDVKGKSGCAYIAKVMDPANGGQDDVGSVYPAKESPIGFVIVSDDPGTPEPTSFVLFGTTLVFIWGIFWIEQRRKV